jgi:hypothetical protein
MTENRQQISKDRVNGGGIGKMWKFRNVVDRDD